MTASLAAASAPFLLLSLSLLLFTLELRWAIIPEWESKIEQRLRLAESRTERDWERPQESERERERD